MFEFFYEFGNLDVDSLFGLFANSELNDLISKLRGTQLTFFRLKNSSGLDHPHANDCNHLTRHNMQYARATAQILTTTQRWFNQQPQPQHLGYRSNISKTIQTETP